MKVFGDSLSFTLRMSLRFRPLSYKLAKPSLAHWQFQRFHGQGESKEYLQCLCPCNSCAHQWTSARISGVISRKQTRHPLFRHRTKSLSLPTGDATHLVLGRASLRPRTRAPKFSHLRATADPNQRRTLIRYTIYNSPNLGLVIINGIRDLIHYINNSSEATNLVGDLMQSTDEKNIHIQTGLHLNKGDDNARGHIGTELNNKAGSVLLIAKDTKDADRRVVSPAVIRSKAFAPFTFYCCPVNFKTAEKSSPKPLRIGLRAFFFKKQAPLIK